FSSRRRHTRSKRDWSSDVCSSDLKPTNQLLAVMASRVNRVAAGLFSLFFQFVVGQLRIGGEDENEKLFGPVDAVFGRRRSIEENGRNRFPEFSPAGDATAFDGVHVLLRVGHRQPPIGDFWGNGEESEEETHSVLDQVALRNHSVHQRKVRKCLFIRQ